MDSVAVLVDAGYLFAQGSAALTGSKKPRSTLDLKAIQIIDALQSIVKEKAPYSRLLRIYWYYGAGYSGPTQEQEKLAYMDNVKLRLGLINNQGQQKGVDSLIVSDLIELARNKTISDAVLLSGDEDVRIGVLIAQNYGVRVHLIGIIPCRGSQSKQLIQEADTTTEWGKDTIEELLRYQEPEVNGNSDAITSSESSKNIHSIFVSVVTEIIDNLTTEDRDALKEHFLSNNNIPQEYDGRLLARCREQIKRDLTELEKRQARQLVRRSFG